MEKLTKPDLFDLTVNDIFKYALLAFRKHVSLLWGNFLHCLSSVGKCEICVYSCFPCVHVFPALHSSLECYVPRLCDRHVTMSPNFLVSLTLSGGCRGINQMGLRDTGPVSRAALVMMSAKTDQSVMIVMIGSQGNCHKLITPTASREGKG